MTNKIVILTGIVLIFAAGLAAGISLKSDQLPELVSVANATSTTVRPAKSDTQDDSEKSPVKALTDRDVYYPGSEDLAPDEMRIVACGTGMPNARPKQAASCFLVELGNGDKFLFDIGADSHERIAAQKIPYDYLDKVFISHLHVDHFGDLASFWLGWHCHESPNTSADLGTKRLGREIRHEIQS